MAEVVLENVTKIFPNGVRAVHDLNLPIHDGELMVLVGPSGSGKSTTLRLIAGLERPTSGTIRIDGRIVNELPAHDRDVAIVFQRHTLYPHLDVRHNLSASLDLRNRWRWLTRWLRGGAAHDLEVEKRVENVAALLGIRDLLERKPNQLSGGQQQRVAVGRALVREPAVFLLDEPLSHLDSPIRAELRRQLHLLHRRLPATMVYVTHDPVEAMILGDRVVVLHEGAALQTGSPAVVYNEPSDRRVARFFGWPSMNLIDGLLERDAGGLRWEHTDVSMRPPESWRPFAPRQVTLGIRPHELRLTSSSVQSADCDWSMRVATVELLGQTRLVTLRRGNLEVCAETSAMAGWNEGETVTVNFDLKHAHLFDGDHGQALLHGQREA